MCSRGSRASCATRCPTCTIRRFVELGLEVCTDALAAATRAGTESTSIMRETLQQVQSHLVWQLYRIEVPRANRVLSRAAAKRN